MPSKETLFGIGRDAVEAISRHRGLYACPLCTRLLPFEAIGTRDLILEHVPAESMGGRGILLTCETCNSTAGHTIDAAVQGRERYFDLQRAIAGRGGSFEDIVRIEAGGVSTNALLNLADGKATIEVRERINHPDHFRGQYQHLERDVPLQGSTEIRLTAGVNFKWRHARVGDLKSAFLGAVALFGYRYAFHPRLEQVRAQIQDPDAVLIEGAWYTVPPAFEDDPMLAVMEEPFPGVLVRLRTCLIALPWTLGPDPFYPAVRDSMLAGDRDAKLTFYEWPTTMIMLLDLRGRPLNPTAPGTA